MIPTIDKLDLESVALRQSRLLYAVLAMIAIQIVWVINAFSAAPSEVAYGILALQFGVTIWGIAGLVLMMSAMRASVLTIVISAIVLFFPILGILVILSASSQATMMLRLGGAKVGMLGASSSERAKLVRGACRGCGYSREGLETLAPCPECNRVPIVW